MNKNFTNFRMGLAKWPVIVAGVFFLSHPTITHASEDSNLTEPNSTVVHDDKQTTNELNNIESKEEVTNINKTSNSSVDNKSANENGVTSNNTINEGDENGVHDEASLTSSDNRISENNEVSRAKEDVEKSKSNTNGNNEATKLVVPELTDEQKAEDAYFTDPNFRYDTSKDPKFDEDGALIDTRRKLENYKVRNRTAYIHVENGNYKGQIENLKHAVGTGSIIKENYILTAAHVIYSNNYPRGYLTGGYVIPGKHGDSEKFGRYKIKAMHVMPQYISSPLHRYDIGIIEIEPHSEIPPYNFKPFNKEMIGKKIESQGYPIDMNENSIDQYFVDGTIIQKQPKGTVELSMYGYSGQSGSPVILESTDDVIGVYTYGTKGNEYGTLMTPITHEIYNWIQSIINKNDKVEDTNKKGEEPKVDDSDKVDNADKTDEQPKVDNSNKVDSADKTTEQPKVDDSTIIDSTDKSVEQPKIDDSNKVDNADKSDVQPKVDDTDKPSEQPKVDDSNKADNANKIDEQPKMDDSNKVDSTDKSGEEPKVDDSNKINSTDKSDEQPKVDDSNKDDSTNKPGEAPKVDDSNKVNNADKTREKPKVDNSNKVDDIDKSDEKPKVDNSNKDENTVKTREKPKVDNAKQPIKAITVSHTDNKTTNVKQLTTSHTHKSNEPKANTKHDDKQLPNTGEYTTGSTTLFGTLFAALGSLLLFRKRKTDK
jgi:LPXTG-motif cell wall-anchored protein